MEQRIFDFIHQGIEAKMQAGEVLAPAIIEASQMVVESLLNDNKVLVCASGLAAANGMTFSALLNNRHTYERPSLPAITLGVDPVSSSAITLDMGLHEIFSRQIRALAQPGDTLLVLSGGQASSSLIQAISAAHDRQAQVIALSSQIDHDITSVLDNNDLSIVIPCDQIAQIHELQQMVVFCMSELIDEQLFGGMA